MPARFIELLRRDAGWLRERGLDREAGLLEYYVTVCEKVLLEVEGELVSAERELLTSEDAFAEFGLNEKRLYRARRSGRLLTQGKRGNSHLYCRGDLRQLIQPMSPPELTVVPGRLS